MLKRFHIWFYRKKLEYRFKKNGVWTINEQFILAVVNGFNDKWLRDIGPLTVNKYTATTHYKNAIILLEVLMDLINFIDKQNNVIVNGSHYSSFPQSKNLIDYLTNTENKLIDIYTFQMDLKIKTNRLIYLLEKTEKESEIQYGYYRRNCDKLFSDILELYSSFLEIVEQK